MKQMTNIIRKHNNSFLPAKSAFNMKPNDVRDTNSVVIDSSGTQRRKQKRMRITSNKEKFCKQKENKNLQCIVSPATRGITIIFFLVL